ADNHDPETTRFKYRIDALYEIESGVMGGSWARSKEFLQCGYRLGISAGIRYPDLGFRPVRAPVGKDWRIQPRKGSAVALADGQVLLTWALLASDTAHTRFNVYMASERNHAGFLQNTTPLSTPGYVDENAEPGQRYYYYVKPVDAKGEEGRRSEWWGITIPSEPTAVITQFHPVHTQGALVPIFGDLNGDGKLDCVIRMDNGNAEMSQDPGIPVRMEAFTSYGRSLWRKDICNHDHCFGSANNVPFNVWDMDGDGKTEVITRLQQGEAVFVAILDGMTGKVKYQAPWPDMVSDFAKSSTRIHLSIAYLDGKTPAVITQTGLYENEVFAAYDHQLNELWRFDSFAETNGSGAHAIAVADVDDDGKQEVFNGTTCLNADGSLRWSIYRQHPDLVSVHDFLPERPGLEVFYIVESSVHAGVYLVDANTGTVIWKVNREDDPRWTHGHTGWAADIWDGAAGIECVSNRAGHDDTNLVLFSADGQVLLEPFPFGYQPMEWDGDPTRELLQPSDMTLYDFDGKTLLPHPLEAPRVPAGSSFVMAADLYGDFRDELVVVTKIGNQNGIAVISATTPTEKKFITPTQSLDYRLWLGRNMGGGYRTVYDMPLVGLK
ncbi:MAG: hypothetical protein RBU29_09495, partial [bacterium]|nr:hypothetical protein [bacterium]